MVTVNLESVSVVDGNPLVRERTAAWLRAAGYLVHEYSSGGKFLAEAEERETSCVIIDTEIPDINPLKLQKALVALGRREQMIFVSGRPNIPTCVAVIRAGALDYQAKPLMRDKLLAAVREGVSRSAAVAGERDIRRDASSRVSALTRREREVLQLLIRGYANREVAEELGAAEATIKIHRRHIMEKARVRSLPELVVLAQHAGITVGPESISKVG